MTKQLYPYRISFNATDKQRSIATKVIPWGVGNRLLQKVYGLLLDMLDQCDEPEVVIGLILGGHLKFEVDDGTKRLEKEHPGDDTK